MTRLLNIFQAARILSLTSAEVRRLVDDDAVPHIVMPGIGGDRVRFDREDLARFIRNLKDRPPINSTNDTSPAVIA